MSKFNDAHCDNAATIINEQKPMLQARRCFHYHAKPGFGKNPGYRHHDRMGYQKQKSKQTKKLHSK